MAFFLFDFTPVLLLTCWNRNDVDGETLGFKVYSIMFTVDSECQIRLTAYHRTTGQVICCFDVLIKNVSGITF
jgi:hypothetical protein